MIVHLNVNKIINYIYLSIELNIIAKILCQINKAAQKIKKSAFHIQKACFKDSEELEDYSEKDRQHK